MNNSKIKTINSRQIIDSRGNPTVEADVILQNGIVGRASVPSGASRGTKEAFELRDGEAAFGGKSVRKALAAIQNEVVPLLSGLLPFNQQEIDNKLIELDGTDNKSRLGANSILAVSLAVARAAANAKQVPLYQHLQTANFNMPVPMMNILNGGQHADNSLDMQEFMIVPTGVNSISDAIQMGSEVFYTLKKLLKTNRFSTAVGDEGGFAPDLKSNEQALDLLCEAATKCNLKLGSDIHLAIDVAASEFYSNGNYVLQSENLELNYQQITEIYEKWCKYYPIVSIEDPLAEFDFEGWQYLTGKIGSLVQLVGDDLFVTNCELLKKGIELKIANSVLIKVNQIGTLTETLDTIELAKQNDYTCVISHRSGETEDTFIADLAVASGVGQIKTGSLNRTDRTAKYNQLLRIESELKDVNYLGIKAFSGRK